LRLIGWVDRAAERFVQGVHLAAAVRIVVEVVVVAGLAALVVVMVVVTARGEWRYGVKFTLIVVVCSVVGKKNRIKKLVIEAWGKESLSKICYNQQQKRKMWKDEPKIKKSSVLFFFAKYRYRKKVQ
jgi:hypothetical protein